jgi:protein O-mannosyl-transferase
MRSETECSRYRLSARLALLLLAGTAVYANSLHVPFIMDDNGISFFGHKDILDILLHGGARRVADATFALNYRLQGSQVTGYHLANLAIHIMASMTLYFVVAAALDALRTSFPHHGAPPTATAFVESFVPLAAALLFVLHPVQTQAVTYIIQRYTSLATLFYLLAVLFFLKARLTHEKDATHSYPRMLGCVSLAAAVLALWTKQIAATLPLMLIILELFLFRGRMFSRRVYIACGALAILVLSIVLISWQDRSAHDIIASLRQATAEDPSTPRSVYLLTQIPVVATYLRLLCLPFGQSIFHDSPLYTTVVSAAVITALALHIFLITAAIALFRTSRQHLLTGVWLHGVLQRLAALGIAWFYCAMIVESSIFPITDVIFEHRIYLPSAGFFLTVTSGTALAACGRHNRFKAAWALLAAACLVLGGLTVARNFVWNDTLKLWRDAAIKSNNKDIVLANLAGEYMKLNMPEKALPLFVRALELHPDFKPATKIYLGKTLQYLYPDWSRFTTGEELVRPGGSSGEGDVDRADRFRMEGVLRNNMALAYEYLGEPGKAREAYQAALRANPAYDLAWYNLGLLSVRMGDRVSASNAVRQLKNIKPYLAEQLNAAMSQ